MRRIKDNVEETKRRREGNKKGAARDDRKKKSGVLGKRGLAEIEQMKREKKKGERADEEGCGRKKKKGG